MKNFKKFISAFVVFILLVTIIPACSFAMGIDLSEEDFDPFQIKHTIGQKWSVVSEELRECNMFFEEFSTGQDSTAYVWLEDFYGYLGLDYDHTYPIIYVDNNTKKVNSISYYSFYEKDRKVTSNSVIEILYALGPYLADPEYYTSSTSDDMPSVAWYREIDSGKKDIFTAFWFVADWMDVFEIDTTEGGAFVFAILRTD